MVAGERGSLGLGWIWDSARVCVRLGGDRGGGFVKARGGEEGNEWGFFDDEAIGLGDRFDFDLGEDDHAV